MYHGHEERRHEEECGCGGHGHHEERSGERYEGHGGGGDCGCGGRGHHESRHGWGCPHHGYRMGFGMGWRHGGMHGFGMGMGMGFRRFVSRDEIISRLEEYLKQLQAEAKAVEERIEELKRRGEHV